MPERIIKYRNYIIIASIAITVLAGLMLPRLDINPNLDDYVPDYLENKAYLKELNSIFGSTEMILVMLRADNTVNAATLERLWALSEDRCQVEGISSCVSPLRCQGDLLRRWFHANGPSSGWRVSGRNRL